MREKSEGIIKPRAVVSLVWRGRGEGWMRDTGGDTGGVWVNLKEVPNLCTWCTGGSLPANKESWHTVNHQGFGDHFKPTAQLGAEGTSTRWLQTIIQCPEGLSPSEGPLGPRRLWGQPQGPGVNNNTSPRQRTWPIYGYLESTSSSTCINYWSWRTALRLGYRRQSHWI